MNTPLKFIKRQTTGRIFAIGDIHGCFNELQVLINFLKKEQGLTHDDQLIFLGDYIDRGPNSSKVLDLLIELKVQFPNTIYLKGNHEDMFLGFIGLGGNYGEWSIANGSRKLVKEYGLEKCVHESYDGAARIVRMTKEEFREHIPAKHLEFLQSLHHYAMINGQLFVHAGLDLYKPLEDQTEEDLLWIREGFIGTEHKLNYLVVHGHTIMEEVMFNLPYEIDIDTGCFLTKQAYDRTGKLSCLALNQNTPVKSKVYSVLNGTKEVIENE